MAVIGVLTEPTPPTWWQANRHKVYGVSGLLLGYLISSHAHSGPDQQPHPRPGHTTPAPTTPSTHHTPTTH
ncbi:hypothetical protein ABT112_26810 [Streptomyces sp. NPDC002055]|uniref:hypothetical protein n=1 Tax=Streptomyces sp. NPDC002055 TaxID=3154534 RepID=UPI0033247175